MEIKSVIFLFLAGFTLCYGTDDIEDAAQETSIRILDGTFAAEGQFPYVVSVQLWGTGQVAETRGHRCGGALITPSHVVTAASCLFELVGGVPVLQLASQYRVFAGSILLTNDTVADRTRAVANFTIHPDYTGLPALVNNIAVLTLNAPFPAVVATPIALASANFNPPDFTTCTVVGWGGFVAGQNASVAQRFANKYVYNQNLCMTIWNSIPSVKNILPSMVCAVSLDLLSSNCAGDDGNPLVCAGTFTGILSRSDDCTRSTLPEIYTRISNQTRWLRDVSASSTIYAPGIFVMAAVFSLMQIMFSA